MESSYRILQMSEYNAAIYVVWSFLFATPSFGVWLLFFYIGK